MVFRTLILAASVAATALAAGAQERAENVALATADTNSAAAAAKADPANWRAVDPENLFIFETTKGRVLIEAIPEIAPRHVEQFRAIIRSGDYDGTAFHRVIDDFMAQGGDVEALHGRPSGLPNIPAEFSFRRRPDEMPFALLGPAESATDGYFKGAPVRTQSRFLAEFSADGLIESWIPHCAGVVSTARVDGQPDSANSQFFLMREHSPHLDKQYTAWGRIVSDVETVRSIKPGSDSSNGAVRQPDILREAMVAADMDAADRPKVWVRRVDAAGFADILAAGQDENVCDLAPVETAIEG